MNLQLVSAAVDEEQSMNDDTHSSAPPHSVNYRAVTTSIIASVIVLLIGGLTALTWNTNTKVTHITTTLTFMAAANLKSEEDIDQRQAMLERQIDRVERHFVNEIKRLETHLNTAWARIGRAEQKLKIERDIDEYSRQAP